MGELSKLLEFTGLKLIKESVLDEKFDIIEEMVEELAEQHGVDPETIWEDFEAVDDETLYETAAWKRKEGKSKTGGLNKKGVASYRREHPGSKLQTAVTTKPSKLKKGSKASKRRKSFCARMGGMKGPMKKPNGKPTRKALALRKWNCHESVEQQELSEIKKGQKDSNGYTRCWPGKHAEGTKKGKNGGQVRNCVPNESIEEGRVDSPVSQAITRRIINQRPDLIKYGPEAVMAAVDEVASWVGDVEEIGTSDVSSWVDQVSRYLKAGEGIGEAANAAQQAAIAIAKKKKQGMQESPGLSRHEMMFALEDYWYGMQEKYPDEPMDVPAAMEYYRTLSDEELADEYAEKIGIKEARFGFNKQTGQMSHHHDDADQRHGLYLNGRLIRTYNSQQEAENVKLRDPRFKAAEIKKIAEALDLVSLRDVAGIGGKDDISQRMKNMAPKRPPKKTADFGKKQDFKAALSSFKKGMANDDLSKFREGGMGGINRSAPAVDVSYEKVLDEVMQKWNEANL
jgi:hypothetical protein